MKKHMILFVSLLLIFILCACGDSSESDTPKIVAPEDRVTVFGDFVSETLTGEIVDQSVFSKNTLTMVNIWGTFCSPCIKEMPELGEISAEYVGKGFAIIGIPADITDKNGSPSPVKLVDAKNIVDAAKADYTHIIPCAEMIENKLGSCQSLPETIFLDSEGRQVGDSYFGAKSKEEWTFIIDCLLEALK